jgi:YesN/AraC family two-component response regulator
VGRKNEIISLLNRILRERESGELESAFLSQLLVMELFVHISRALKLEWEISISEKSLKRKELIEISARYIQTHYSRNLSLEDIAKYVF